MLNFFFFTNIFTLHGSDKWVLSKTQRKNPKEPRERYQNISEEEKDKKDRWKKIQESYQILTKEEEEKDKKNISE